MARSSEWLITSAESVRAKRERIRAQDQPPGVPAPDRARRAERQPHPAPGFGGDRRLPEEEPGDEQQHEDSEDPDTPFGVPV